MQNDAATLYCPNDLCQAANSQTDKFCQQCGTPLSKSYLWAVGEGIESYKVGDILAERYLLKSDRIFLDTKPSLVPVPSSAISDAIKPYLKLVPYRLHVPQVYGLIPVEKGRTTEILLLEQAPIYPDGMPLEGQLMPELVSVWNEATSMRQLNWLWQMAQLWQPLSSEGVASSLLEPRLLRVEGSLVRLLECVQDRSYAPALAELGQMWKAQWTVGARPAIAEFLEQLCLALIQGKVNSSEQLIAILDQGLAEVGRDLLPSTIQIVTYTDTGPSRQRNEDACYPPSGTSITSPPELEALGIVCDGVGGHEGGNVASNLAIETIQQRVQQILLDNADLDATNFSTELEYSACVANDTISQRNDDEHRHGRQRMGTTLVMALARAHEIYVTHVGDSRAYWITRNGCHQVTLDDDVASRDVRLGVAPYRNALQQMYSGSLVQALGMGSSLHPTVQRFVLDEDCVFLLCSDGLSDYDRVEQCWETEILPILDGKINVVTAGSRLIEIANTQNGHDNVTVGLVYCQVSSSEPESTVGAFLTQQITFLQDAAYPAGKTMVVDTNNPEPPHASPSTFQTEVLGTQPAPRRFLVPVLVGIILLLGLGGGLLAYLRQGSQKRHDAGPSPINMPAPTSSVTPAASNGDGSPIQNKTEQKTR